MRVCSPVERPPSPALRAGSVRVSRRVKAPPARIFDAWLDLEGARMFLLVPQTGDAVSSEMDARVGGRFRIVRRCAAGEIEYSGEFLEIDRPNRLVFSLFIEKHAQRDDRVVLELAPLGEESLLVLTHEHSLPGEAHRARIQSEWAIALDGLNALCNESASRMAFQWLRTPVFARWDADSIC